MSSDIDRRRFLETAAASAAAFTIIPRHVLGGPGYVPPSDRITLAHIGFGTQAIREVGALLASPEVQLVAMCDVEKDGQGYIEWTRHQLRDGIRKLIQKPNWRENVEAVPGGRDVGKEIVETYYAQNRGTEKYSGCNTYVDFREMLEKERDLDAVKVMTPDHTHATAAVAAMKKGKHVIMHKPLANRLIEARMLIETARRTKVGTHFLPASDGAQHKIAAEMIREGAIGTLREIHNWSNRPAWPQFPTLPTDRPPIPRDFDWTLWLGPSLDRPYHPNYTHTNFRGWYEFGGGSIADMGHYSLWPVFQIFELDSPISVESTPAHTCMITDRVSRRVFSESSFPLSCTVRARFAARGSRPAIDLYWYDGGIRPPVPEELMSEGKELEAEGMMFVGDKGRIIGGYRCENPQLVPESRVREYRRSKNLPEPSPAQGRGGRGGAGGQGGQRPAPWIQTFKGGPPTYGDFRLGQPISDFMNLAAISLRLRGRRLVWDAANVRITNMPEANKYLTREYRPGWELTGV